MDIKELTKYSASIPLPWLAGTIIALLFNAGIMYQQFADVKITMTMVQPLSEKVTALNSRVDLISERISGVDARMTGMDERLTDHERRIRRTESGGRIASSDRPRDHGQ